MLSQQLRYRLRTTAANVRSQQGPLPKYDEEIFAGGDYPRSWDEVVGQERAKARLQAAIESAKMRGTRLDHTLLCSGLHGIGKTTLGKLTAYQMKVGYIEVSGIVSVDEARPILRGMRDGDILFWDEIHLAVSGGKAKAEWLLPFLQDGGLMTARGFEPMPDVTVLGATTDAQRLPQTFLSRFMVQPVLEGYTEAEAEQIARRLSVRMGFGRDGLPTLTDEQARELALASNGAPREMRALLIALRDAYYVKGELDLDQARDWVGVTRDGLNELAANYLMTLLVMCEGQAGEKVITSALGEPGPLRHTEQILTQKGLLTIEPNGRRLTEPGMERALQLLREKGIMDDE